MHLNQSKMMIIIKYKISISPPQKRKDCILNLKNWKPFQIPVLQKSYFNVQMKLTYPQENTGDSGIETFEPEMEPILTQGKEIFCISWWGPKM